MTEKEINVLLTPWRKEAIQEELESEINNEQPQCTRRPFSFWLKCKYNTQQNTVGKTF